MKRIDQIRQMSSEELANLLAEQHASCAGCVLFDCEMCKKSCIHEWLEEEVQEDA